MTYTLDDGFRPRGAATLSTEDDILILERRLTLNDGVATRIRFIDSSHIMPAAEIVSTMVAEFRAPIKTGGFEGIAVRMGIDDSVIVYIISDDNLMLYSALC